MNINSRLKKYSFDGFLKQLMPGKFMQNFFKIIKLKTGKRIRQRLNSLKPERRLMGRGAGWGRSHKMKYSGCRYKKVPTIDKQPRILKAA